MHNNDLSLMQRAAEGDHQARVELVRRLMPRAQRLCNWLIRNRADAKDASQAALVEVVQSTHNFRGDSSIEQWASRIVVRTALRWAANERKRHFVPAEVDAATDGDVSLRVLLKQCIDRLGEPHRTTVILRCVFEHSVDEIAELTQVSRNTVKDRLLRARVALREFARAPYEGSEHEASDSSELDTLPLARPRVPLRR